MARMTRTSAASAVTRNFLSRAVAALAAALLVTMTVGEAAAQKAPTPPAPTTTLVEDGIDLCAMFSGDSVAAEDQLVSLGWTIEYSEANGPFVWEINASKIYPDGSDAYLFVLLETYPDGWVAYCTFDVTTIPTTPDLAAITEIYDVVGEVQLDGDMAYGHWSQFNEGTWYYVLANTSPNYLFIQVTAVTSNETTGTVRGK